MKNGSGGPRSSRAAWARRVGAAAVALVVTSAAPADAKSTWSVVPAASVAKSGQHYLDAVSCAPASGGAATCFAVGSIVTLGGATRPLVERWNGRRWNVVST